MGSQPELSAQHSRAGHLDQKKRYDNEMFQVDAKESLSRIPQLSSLVYVNQVQYSGETQVFIF